MKNQVFNHYHHNATELSNDIRTNPSDNYNDKEYLRSFKPSHSQINSDPCVGLGCKTFNVPNYPPEPPKEGRIGQYEDGGKWVIPATPRTTPNNLIQSDPCSGFGCDTFNVPNYPPEPPKEGRIGKYEGGKWIIPATPLTTPNNLVQRKDDPCVGFDCGQDDRVTSKPPSEPRMGKYDASGIWVLPGKNYALNHRFQ